MAVTAEHKLPDNKQHNGRQINEQTKENKSRGNNSFKNNLHINDKIKQEIDYFITGLGIEANRGASTKQHLKCKMNIVMNLQQLGASYIMQSHTRKCQGMEHMHYESHLLK